MAILVGTSGYSYAAWKGEFYPRGCKNDAMLEFYAQRFAAVEINNTFYRMPKAAVMERWAELVPDGFRFVLKASQRITHQNRLVDSGDNVRYLYAQAEPLGDKLGAVLFQTPPFLRKDIDVLRAFLGTLPSGARPAFEFRHRSWFDDDVFDALREAGGTVCVADAEKKDDPVAPVKRLADWGYVRLRQQEYTEQQLETWRETAAQTWDTTFMFTMHEDAAPSPATALQLHAMRSD